jgi:coproporphyrinogen III oxidase
MSLPPLVRWEYCPTVEAGSREEILLTTLKNPKDWFAQS